MEAPVFRNTTEAAICRIHTGITVAGNVAAPGLGLLFRFLELPGSVAHRAFQQMPRVVS